MADSVHVRKKTNIFFDNDLNIPEQDGSKCAYCKQEILLKKYLKEEKDGVYIEFTDRSNRVDCDIGRKKQTCLVSYHKECWKKLIEDS